MGQGIAGKKPIVMLLENYVLDRIGLLGQTDELTTRVIMEKAFQEKGDWRKRLVDELGLTPELDGQLKAMWKQAQGLTTQKGASLSPREFAEMVVEENFQDVVSMVDPQLS